MERQELNISLGNKDGGKTKEAGGAEETAKQIQQIHINIAVISVMWMFTYTAFTGLQNLQSSLNHDLGTYALGFLTAGTCLVCLVSPIIICRLGCKQTLAVSWVCLCVFIGANYDPQVYIIIPAAFLEGIATGLAWTAQGVYVTTSAAHYAALTGKSLDSVLSVFFGIFFMAYQSTQVWGNLISSAVYQHSSNNFLANITDSFNETAPVCGAQSCPSSSFADIWMEASAELDYTLRYVLLSIFMAFAVAGFAVTVVFLQPMEDRTPRQGTLDLLMSTLTLLKSDLNMALLVPLFLYIGLEQAFIFAEFTKAYVTCAIGIGWVGYTMLCFGLSVTIVSPVSGVLGRYLRRSILLTWALLLNLIMLVVLLLWKPSTSDLYMYFLVPAVWGLADAFWQTQSSALSGSIFYDDQEAAFANLRMFVSLGKTFGYLYSAVLCQYVKLYIAGSLVVAAVLLHTAVDIRTQHKPRGGYKSFGD